jgi:hypothetical protein
VTPPLPDRIAAAIERAKSKFSGIAVLIRNLHQMDALSICGIGEKCIDELAAAIAEVVVERDAATKRADGLAADLADVQAKLAKVERQIGSARAQIQNLTSTVRPWWVVFGMDRSDARGFHDDVRNLGIESVERSMRILAEKAGKRGIHPAEVARALDEACEELCKAAADQGGACAQSGQPAQRDDDGTASGGGAQ